MRVLFALFLSLFIVSCGGYQPVAKYSKTLFQKPVLVKVKIDPEDPSTGVYLQEEITKMAVNRLNLTTTKNVDEAKGYILVNSYTINTTPVTKDDNGNVIRYSINAALEFAVKDKKGFWSKNIVASEYVPVKAKSSVSVAAKQKASKLAIKKALDDFVVAVIKRAQKLGSQEDNNTKKELNQKPNSLDNSVTNTQDNATNTQDSVNDSSIERSSAIPNEDTSNKKVITVDNEEGEPIVNLVVSDEEAPSFGY